MYSDEIVAMGGQDSHMIREGGIKAVMKATKNDDYALAVNVFHVILLVAYFVPSPRRFKKTMGRIYSETWLKELCTAMGADHAVIGVLLKQASFWAANTNKVTLGANIFTAHLHSANPTFSSFAHALVKPINESVFSIRCASQLALTPLAKAIPASTT